MLFIVMKISIITPTFNYRRFLVDALQSVKRQVTDDSQVAVEHVVVDACSTDGTLELLRKWTADVRGPQAHEKLTDVDDGRMGGRIETDDGRYTFRWISEPDKGQSDAINKGFRMATGDIFGWLNADDYYLPDAFNTVRSALGENGSEIIYGDFQYVDIHKNLQRFCRPIDFNKLMLIFRCYIPSTTFFFKRHIIDQNFFIDEKLEFVMDKDYFLRLAQAGFQFLHIPEVIAAFRWQGENKSISYPKAFHEESIGLIRKYRKKFSKNPLIDELYLKLQILYYCRFKHAWLKFYSGKWIQERRDLLNYKKMFMEK